MSVIEAIQTAIEEYGCTNWMNVLDNAEYQAFLAGQYPHRFLQTTPDHKISFDEMNFREFADEMVLHTAQSGHYYQVCYKLNGILEGPFEARHVRTNEVLAKGMHSNGRPVGKWLLVEAHAVVDCTNTIDPRVEELDAFTIEF